MSELLIFLNSNSVWVYAFIFFGKIVEVSISTLRLVLISRGERTIGSIVALVEVSLWLLVTGTVLTGFQSDFIKIIVFVVAFAIGNFIGSWLEEKLAFGLSNIHVIVHNKETRDILMTALREKGFGVTMMKVYGMDDTRYMLLLILRRRMVKEALNYIDSICPNALVTIGNVEAQGGYIYNFKSRIFPLHNPFTSVR